MYDMDDTETQRMEEFVARKYTETIELQKNDPKLMAGKARKIIDSGTPFFRFIDLGYSIEVTPTSVGAEYKVKFHYPGLEEEINVTNYDVW